VIKFVAVQVSEKHPNDTTFVITDNDVMGSKKIGHDTLTCKIVGQTKAKCKIVFTRSSGTISASLTLSFSATGGRGTITGGTGEYTGASGTIAFKNLNKQGTRTSVALTLT
jgi:hypothetical protein